MAGGGSAQAKPMASDWAEFESSYWNTDSGLEGSTGMNDSTSPWGAGLLQAVDVFGRTTTGILGAVRGNKSPVSKSAALSTSALLLLGAVVVALIFLLRK